MAFIKDESDMDKLTAVMTVRVTPEVKETMERLAMRKGKNSSDEARKLFIGYINDAYEDCVSLESIFRAGRMSDKESVA